MARRRRYTEEKKPDTYKVSEYESVRRSNSPDTNRVGDYERRRQAGEFNKWWEPLGEARRQREEQQARGEAAGAAGRQAIYDSLNRNRVNGAMENAPQAVKKTVTLDDLVKKPAEEQQAQQMNTAMGENGPRQPFSAAAKQLQDRIDRDRQKVTKEGVTSFSSWVGNLGKEYKKGDRNVTPKNATEYLAKREAQIQGGQFSTSRDARLHSNAQQKQDYVAAQNEAEQARKKQLQMHQWRNENLPQTEEEKQALRERSEELNEKPGTWLDENGLNVGNINDLDNIRKRPDDYFDKQYEYDEFIYDWMHGNGSYDERIESIETDHDVDVLEEELDRMWDRLESGDMHLYDEENTAGQEELKRNRILLEDADYGMSKRVEQADKYVDELKEETERDAMLEQMAEQAPAAKPFDVSMNPRVLGPYQIEGDSADRAFYEVNNSWWDLDARGAAYGPQPERQDWKDEWFMSDVPMPQYNGRSEKDIFNAYYREGLKDEAMAFLEGLRPDLKYRRAKAQEYANRETARLEVGGVNIGGAIGVGASLAKPFAGVIESVDVLGSLFGIKGSGDMASQWHQLGNVIRDARDERGNVWDEAVTGWFGQEAAGWGKKFNGALYSILDNAVAMGGARAATAGVAPEKALKALTGSVQFIMSNGAAADDFAQRIDKGMDPDEAAVYAVSQGIIEAITEKYSVEALFKDDPLEIMNNIGKFMGKNFFTEGAEEVASDLLSRFTDDILSTVYGHESEFRERYRELQEDHNDQDAMRIAWGEVFQQFGESFLFGGLSGFVMSGGRVIGNKFNARQAGQNIRGVDSIMENGGTQQVISAGEAMGEGSQSAKLAAELKQKAESGKRIRTGKLGRLAQSIQVESQMKAQETVNQTVEEKVQAAMVDNGVDPAQAKQLAAAAREGVINGVNDLNSWQRKALEQTKGAMEAILQVQNDAEVAQQIRENTAKYQSAAETAANLSEGRTAEGIDPETVGQHLANEEDIRNATGDRTGGVREVIVNHEYATLDGMEQDGDGNWKYKVTSNGKTSLLDASDIKATNFSAAAVIRENAVNPKFYSGAYTNELLNQIDKGNVQNVARYLTDAYKVRWAAYLGQEMPQTQLAETAAKELYRVSMTDAAEARKAQAAERPANYRGAGKGTATFNGTEYGTEAFDKAIGDVDSETRARIDYVANLAKASGIELNLIDTAAEDYDAAVHGWENGSGIVLNLDSYDSRAAKEAGRKHHIVATMSHEMTHWLQRNNAGGYLRLQSFVLDNMAREGVDVAARAENLMAQRDISMTEAIDEIVANACDQVLGNEAIANRLKETDGKLYSAIKGFVQELVKKIRSAVVGMEDSASRDARKLMYKYGNELAKIWTGVYDEVLQGKISEIETAEGAAKQSRNEEYYDNMDRAYTRNNRATINTDDPKLMEKVNTAIKNRDIKTLQDFYKVSGLHNQDLGDLYSVAWRKGNFKLAEDILMNKILGTEGVTPYKAPNWYDNFNQHRLIANMLKEGNREAVTRAAAEMSMMVPDNAVLVPMPNHHGVVDEHTDTMVLAQEISRITGRPVINALAGAERESRKDNKAKPKAQQQSAKDLGFYQTQEIPKGMIPYFIDNVIGSGVTAKAAHDAIGYGVTLAYAKSSRSAIEGLKNAAPTYYDPKQTILVPLEERVDMNKKGVAGLRYSKAEDLALVTYDTKTGNYATPAMTDETGMYYGRENSDGVRDLYNENGDAVATILPGNTVAATKYSYSSWVTDKERDKVIKKLKQLGYSEKQIKSWIKNLDTISNIIARDRAMYDFVADRSKSFLKDNGDVYKKTVDASTMCKKTRLYNGTFNVAQHLMPNTVLMPEDLIDLYNIMKDMNLETPCGFCYVQSRRRLLGQYTEEWLKEYKGKYIPSVDEVTTSDGLEKLKITHPDTYEDFVNAMNAKGVNNPKLVQQRTDYRGEIRRMKASTISYLRKIGGLRVQSFSDFETVHMLDMMQAIMDMKIMGLTSQAYTKVPDFAWVFGNTGMKINLSLVGKGTGLDADGNLVFDNDEGINFDEAMKLRQAYSKNVGTVLVGINDDHIIAAMGDGRIDYIIPFHKSGWSKAELDRMRTLKYYDDYTETQNEYNITGRNADGSLITEKADSNLDPLDYWNFSKDGEFNARRYLQKCAEMHIKPKFSQFLTDNGDGTWSLPEGTDQKSTNIRTGYWKTLIDFKMYDNDGVGSRQKVVEPRFNMDAALKILKEYDGSHQELPESWEAAQKFVDQYKKNHPLDSVRKRYSMAEDQMDVNAWMMAQTPGKFQTENERKLLQAYRDMRVKISLSLLRQTEYTKQIRALEEKQNAGTLTGEERDQLINLRNRLEIQESKQGRLEQELYEVTSSSGYAGMMYKHSRLLADQVEGKTQAQVEAAVDSMKNIAEKTAKQIQKRQKELEVLAENNGVKTIQAALKDRGLNRTVEALQTQFVTAMPANELRGRLAEIILKEVNGENITEDINDLAEDVVRRQTSREAEDATEALKMLRGRTIVIGPQQQAELKGRNSNLNEIRRRTRGSGVRFEYGDHSTLESDWMEMQSEALSVDVSNSGDSLENIVGYIEGLLNMQVSDRNEWGVDIDEVRVFLRASVGIVLNDQTGGMSKEKLAEKIRKKEGALDKALAATKETAKTAEQLLAGARKAAGWASFLRRDVQAAIDYYNETAKQAAQVERQEVRKNLIEVLQNEHTRDLIKQSEEYEERIKRDRKARELRDDNESLRKQITTTVKRMKTLLTAETDTKNIQEEAKPLARMVTEMLVRHDMSGFRKVLFSDRKALEDAAMRLGKMNQAYGEVKPERDLDWLVIHGQTEADNDYSLQDKVMQDLMDIEQGLLEYRTAEGQGNITLQDRKNGLEKVQKAISEIYSVIKARGELFIEGKRVQVLDLAEQMREDFSNSRYKGDRQITKEFWNAVGYGNLTPEYFFKRLRNKAMSLLHKGMQSAENRGGLEAYKAKVKLEQIAKDTGFATWDGQEKHKVKVSGGKTVEMTTEQVMSLYATWMREKNQLRPETTAHLLNGGFVLAEAEKEQNPLKRVKKESRPNRMTYNLLNDLGSYLTEQQKQYVDAIVQYMSTDLAELGNEASLQTYGIKKFTEQYYFPIKSWGGVLNQSSASGVNNQNENRAMRQSFSKRVQAGARNAIEISDFTPTAMKHVVGMINFNTIGPAVENMNKVLNQQLEYGEKNEEEDTTFRRNMRAAFREAYGDNAYKYLTQFMQDINGGTARGAGKSPFDRLLSAFKKNAVAGSLSVAAQQPLSYIRAAMMINPKYLAQAISPVYWKGSFKEMLEHSGVAVIKQMGKFDMAYGRSMQDYITPEGKQTTGRKVLNQISDKSTILPQMMDNMTWTRMWSACKVEQKALHPGMDVKSEEFLKLVADRFNEVMRRTQVYDSTMVKSANMRNNHWYMKTITSFMAEPTLSLNVLADAWENVKTKGGKANAVKALTTFLVSGALQAAAKAVFSAGRSPDKKKTGEENWYNKFFYNMLGEVNPLSLIPGYSQLIDTLAKGELTDNSMSVIAKAKEATENLISFIGGSGDKTAYRKVEDSIGQLLQLGTSVPVKNIMRDFRAMVNLISGGTAEAWTGNAFAQRDTSGAVLKYQLLDTIHSEDLAGIINRWMGEAGYGTKGDDYVQRIYDAQKTGQTERAEELRDYYMLAKSSAKDPEKQLNDSIRKMAKEDGDLSAEDKLDMVQDTSTEKGTYNYVLEQLKAGQISGEAARKKIKEIYPDKADDDIWWTVDRAEYERETGKQISGSSYYHRLTDAIEANKSDTIKEAVNQLLKHGITKEKIKSELSRELKSKYLAAGSSERVKIKDAMQKAYRAAGYTAADADKIISGWLKESKKKTNNTLVPQATKKPAENMAKSMPKRPASEKDWDKYMDQLDEYWQDYDFSKNDPVGRYGKGTIDMNSRKVVRNADGSISTEKSFSFYDGDTKKEILIPLIVNGKELTKQKAIDHYYETAKAGRPEYLGMFDDWKDADEYAMMLHNRGAWYYRNK